jgi:hypothetical protein
MLFTIFIAVAVSVVVFGSAAASDIDLCEEFGNMYNWCRGNNPKPLSTATIPAATPQGESV